MYILYRMKFKKIYLVTPLRKKEQWHGLKTVSVDSDRKQWQVAVTESSEMTLSPDTQISWHFPDGANIRNGLDATGTLSSFFITASADWKFQDEVEDVPMIDFPHFTFDV